MSTGVPRVMVRADRWFDGDQFLGFKLTVRVSGYIKEVVEVPISDDTMADIRRERDRLDAKWRPDWRRPK